MNDNKVCKSPMLWDAIAKVMRRYPKCTVDQAIEKLDRAIDEHKSIQPNPDGIKEILRRAFGIKF